MASEHGQKVSPVIVQLFDDARRFDFYQAVRLLERTVADGHAPPHPVGHDHGPDRETVRFRVRQSLAFPTSAIDRLEAGKEKGAEAKQRKSPHAPPPQMLVNFMGLTGPSGVLPRHYTHAVLEQVREGETALRDFLDLFNHRLLSLHYRAWEKYRAAILIENNRSRPAARDVDLFTYALFCLVGMGTGAQRRRMAVDDDLFAYYAGNFSRRPPSAIALQGMIAEYLETPTRIAQFHGRWLTLPRADQTRLPSPGEKPTVAVALGRGAVVGERVWDLQSMFRIRVGPTRYREFRRLMPSGERLLPLCQLVRTYVGPEYEFDVQVVLRADEVPWCRLGEEARLGWNTWIRCRPFERDVDDGVFRREDV